MLSARPTFATAAVILALTVATDASATISLSTDTVNLGSVVVGQSTSTGTPVTITNDGGNVQVNLSSNDADVTFNASEVLPHTLNGNGATMSFHITCTPSSAGVVNATITVSDDDAATTPDLSVSVTCTGLKPGAISIDPTSLSFNDVAVGGGGSDSQIVTISNSNDAEVDLNIEALSIGGANLGDFSITNEPEAYPHALAPGTSVDIEVTFVPTATGPRSATLTIESNDPANPSIDVPLSGDGIDVLFVAPLSISFASIPEGTESSPRDIDICNRGVNSMTISSVVVTGPGFVEVTGVSADTTLAGGVCLSDGGGPSVYQVKFAPPGAADYTGTVTVTTDAPGVSVRAVDLDGTGLSATYSYDPDPTNFGNIDINASSSSLTIDFTNTGESVLRVNSANVTNSVSTAFTRGTVTPSLASPVTLTNGQTVTVDVSADTVDIGAASGELTINYELCRDVGQCSGVTRNAVLKLAAVGTSVNIGLSATSVDFLEHDVDAPSAKEEVVVLTNSGTGVLNINSISIANNPSSVFTLLSPMPPYPNVASGESLDIRVAFAPQVESTGEPTATLVIETQNYGTINITLDGEGIDRRIAPSPRDLVFPDTYRNPASATVGTVEIRNEGKAPLAISMVILEDESGAFTLRTPSFTEVAGQSSDTVEIEFRPTRLRDDPYTAQLVVVNDDDNDPMAVIGLSGLAILPEIAIEPGAIDYGSVGVGVTSEVGLEVPVVDIVNLDASRSFQLTELRVVDLAGQPVDSKLFRVRGLEEPRIVDADGRVGLEVEFNPNKEGRYDFVLQVFAEADNLPITTAPISAEAVDVKLRGGGCGAAGSTQSTGLVIVALLLAAIRFGRRRWASIFFLLLAASAPRAANAQATRNLDLSNFRPTVGVEADFISVENTRVGGHLSWVAGLGINYANRLLVVESEETSMVDVPVNSRVSTDIAAALGLMDRFEVAMRLSLLSQSGEDPQFSSIQPADGFAIGDLAVAVKGQMLSSQPLSLAVTAHASFPTATDEEFAGGGGLAGGVRVLGGFESGRVRLGANLGYLLRGSSRLADVVQGDEVGYGLAGSYLIADELQGVAEFVGAFGLEGDETGGISPLEGLLGVRYHVRPAWGMVAGIGRGLLGGIGAPSFRGFIMLTVAPQRSSRRTIVEEPVVQLDPEGDLDGDGVLNVTDKCPKAAEDFDGFKDDDGCPELDNDEDGLIDSVDRCPIVAEDKDGYLDDDGCPEIDNDGDNIPDLEDQCPDVPEDFDGFKDDDGCDDFDNDEDGVLDLMDACPTEKETINGRDDQDGCPDKGSSAIKVLNSVIVMQPPVLFTGATELSAKAKNVLGQLASTLRARADINKVVVEVYASEEGTAKKRAALLEELLVKQGVAKARLQVDALTGAPNKILVRIVQP